MQATEVPHGTGAVDATRLRMELRRTQRSAVQQLRLSFMRYGCDVSAFGDHEIGEALLEAAAPGMHSSRDLFGRAFERLKTRGAGAR